METITEDGEVISSSSGSRPGQEVLRVDATLVSQLVKAEIDTLITTARAYPRVISQSMHQLLQIVTIDEDSAIECMYALKRKNKDGTAKVIEGPSIRFAEAAIQSWGNAICGARITGVDRQEGYVEAEGAYRDLQTNVMTRATIRRSIMGTSGRIFSNDMIVMTGNAAQSIARRNAICSGIPKTAWRQSYQAVVNIVRGTAETLGNRRINAIKHFDHFGVDQKQIFEALGVKGIEDIGLDHMILLRGMYAAIKNEEATVEEALGLNKGGGGNAPGHTIVNDPLKGEAQTQPAADNGDDQRKKHADEMEDAAKITNESGEEIKSRGRYGIGDKWLNLGQKPPTTLFYDGNGWVMSLEGGSKAPAVQQEAQTDTPGPDVPSGDTEAPRKRGRPRKEQPDETKEAAAKADPASAAVSTIDKLAASVVETKPAEQSAPKAKSIEDELGDEDDGDDDANNRSIRAEPLKEPIRPRTKNEWSKISGDAYKEYAEAVIKDYKFESRSEMLDWWKAERRWRIDLGVPSEVFEPLRDELVKRAKAVFGD